MNSTALEYLVVHIQKLRKRIPGSERAFASVDLSNRIRHLGAGKDLKSGPWRDFLLLGDGLSPDWLRPIFRYWLTSAGARPYLMHDFRAIINISFDTIKAYIYRYYI